MARQLIVLALVFVAAVGLASADWAPASAPSNSASAPSASSPSSSSFGYAFSSNDETASAPTIADSPMSFAPEASTTTSADDTAVSSAGALKISGVVAIAAVAGFFSF